jgi:hypothetical protein
MPKYTFNFDGSIQIEAKDADEAEDKINELLGSLDLWEYNYDIDVESDEDNDED